ncbi:uncharacterized protein BXZ73DRAFT_34734, partial [Epithele typhae]|uniref:uncharacterized protein n=1 Tax=Epithele typhae TaxID=378194 RepID=UPI0020073489
VPVRPLSSLQERKLVEYLEEQFLDITRNYKKRSDPSSSLPTLAAYLEATHRLLSLILQIPPVDPSTPLRTTLLLRLTSEVLQSIPGYAPDPNTLPALLAWLRDLDAGWLATLRADAWDSNASAARPARISSPPPPDAGGEDALDERRREARVTRPSQTERTRLRSALLAGTDALEEWLE